MHISWLEALNFMLVPFIMCLILAGIHCYLGLHVLARGVIFVDLSLAQVAAFGATLAVMLGLDHNSSGTYFVSLSCTFLAAAIFALARRYEKQFSQEAIIGVMYALTAAAVVLVVENMAHGAEHIKELLIGQILWVTWHDVIKTSIIYACVGVVHFIFRKQLIAASFNYKANRSTAGWDFLFYALFGIVITSSVRLAGVLQVFAYLIVPAIVSSIFYQTIRARLIFGWIFGFFLCLFGMVLSFRWDLPAGAFIVVCFASIPIVLLVMTPIFKTRKGNL
jgi:zinc/manganese transport system permease protein